MEVGNHKGDAIDEDDVDDEYAVRVEKRLGRKIDSVTIFFDSSIFCHDRMQAMESYLPNIVGAFQRGMDQIMQKIDEVSQSQKSVQLLDTVIIGCYTVHGGKDATSLL